MDRSGNVFVADFGNHAIRKIAPGGVVTTLAGSAGSRGSDDGTGSAARFYYPAGIAVDATGNLFVSEIGNYTIRKVTAGGLVTTLAGLAGSNGDADGAGITARFRQPWHVAVGGSGNVFATDNNAIRKITADGDVVTVARWDSAARVYPLGLAVDDSGNLFVADGIGSTILKGVPFHGILPAIATQPQSQTAVRGRIAVFNATASGLPAPSYQWTKNGIALAGATDATLLLTNVTATSAGTYQCIVTNAGGSALSHTAILTVVDQMDIGSLNNFSVRATVSAGRSIVAGFVVEGPGQKNGDHRRG